MTSHDFGVARALGLSIVVLLCVGVGWRASMNDLEIIDDFFVVLVVGLAVGVLIMSLSGVRLLELPGGPVIVVRNGLRVHRMATTSIVSIEVVNPGDRRLGAEVNARKTQVVRFGLIDRPSVVAVALLCEPALRARSAGPDGLAPLVERLRVAAGLGDTDRRMGE